MGISDCKDMKVVSFTGKSGTGKSFQATALAQRRGFDAIIDDGLFIYKGQIVAGSSAKKCASKAAAMRTALFNYEDHREEVKAAIESYKPKALMIIGTSDRMTDTFTGATYSRTQRALLQEQLTTTRLSGFRHVFLSGITIQRLRLLTSTSIFSRDTMLSILQWKMEQRSFLTQFFVRIGDTSVLRTLLSSLMDIQTTVL